MINTGKHFLWLQAIQNQNLLTREDKTNILIKQKHI